MQTFQRKCRRTILGLVFVSVLTLAGLSQFSHSALAQTTVAALTNKVFLPIISTSPNIGGTIPH